MLETIFGIFIYIISFFINYLCLCKICTKKFRLSLLNIATVIIISLVNYYSTKIEIILIKSFISFISSFVILRLIIHEDEKRSLVCSLLFMLIVSVIEIICSIFIVNILKVTALDYVTSTSYTKSIIGLFILLIIYLVCSTKIVKKQCEKILDLVDRLKINNQYILITFFMLSIIITFYVINIAGKLKLIYSILYLSIFIIFIFYIIVSLYRNYYLKLINQYLINKEDDYIKLLDEYKMFKHNMKNHLYLLKSVGNKKVNKIIDEYNNEFDTNDIKVDVMSSFPKSMKSLFYSKMIKSDVKIFADNFISNDPINMITLRNYLKFIESIGILVDNAIEEASLCEKPYVYLLLQEEDFGYKILVVNNISKAKFDLDNLLIKGNTKKKDHEGIGLSYIKNKTPFKLRININNDMFWVELIVKK